MQFKDANVEDTGTFEVSILYDMNMLQTIINAVYKVKLKPTSCISKSVIIAWTCT